MPYRTPISRFRRAVPFLGVLGLSAALAGCYRGGAQTDDDEPQRGDGGEEDDDRSSNDDPLATCVDTSKFFQERVWTPILKQKCFACHNESGKAADTAFVLKAEDWPGYLEINEQTMENLVSFEVRLEDDSTLPLLLAKPSRLTDHEGGVVVEPGGEEYAAIEEMLQRFRTPTVCNDTRDLATFFAHIEQLDEVDTLRKATLLLAARLPTPEEIALVEGQGIDALDPVLDTLMHEDGFYVRLREMVNDRLHTDAFLLDEDAVETVDEQTFPTAFWYEALPDDQFAQARDRTNDAIAREPLEIVLNVVRNDRPFTEIVLGDYTMVNPYSARAYGLDLAMFADPNDPGEWVQHDFEEIPQAGILTTSVFLNRYPTTPTNRNRHRSRMVQDFFLGTDVMKLASRPLDILEVAGHNPTLNDPNCNVCHVNIDPLAGAFMNWNENGHYRPMGGWFGDMVAPGFEGEEIDPEFYDTALQWTMNRVVEDPKFALGVVRFFVQPVTGQAPLSEPTEIGDTDYLARIRAAEAQTWKLQQIADAFVADHYEVRTIIKELVKSEYFRAAGYDEEIDAQREMELADMGTARLLPPEALQRKLVATTGYAWMKNGADALNATAYYKFFYGGTDSVSVTERLTEMNGVMANIAERMAGEMACTTTGLDFAKPPAERLLFPMVELADVPGMPGAADAIKANIAYLHEHLLAEHVDVGDPEVLRTYEVFMDVWEDGQVGLTAEVEPYPVQLPGPCRATSDPITGPIPEGSQVIDDPTYTARAWMAVVTYLLGDYRYLYE
jgi:hypothetical protein